mmetsp:Transcript_26900/g.44142  ORF Transcript_26900/g.44142 Transcript_26900/m.44142 type:complete len:90 (-) Transcript_26900:99-368(-)
MLAMTVDPNFLARLFPRPRGGPGRILQSSEEHGFLRDAKRLHVVITRARCCLVVVEDPTVLRTCRRRYLVSLVNNCSDWNNNSKVAIEG